MGLNATHVAVNTPTFSPQSAPFPPSGTANPCRGGVSAAFELNWWLLDSSVKQPLLQPNRWRPALMQRPRLPDFSFVLQVIEDLLDHHRGFDAGNHLHRPTAFSTGLDIDIENTLQARRPSHGRPTLNRRWRLIGYPGTVALAPLCRCHQRSVLAVRRRHAMKTCQVDSGLRHQGGQFSYEIHRLEDDVGSPFPVRRLELASGKLPALPVERPEWCSGNMTRCTFAPGDPACAWTGKGVHNRFLSCCHHEFAHCSGCGIATPSRIRILSISRRR